MDRQERGRSAEQLSGEMLMEHGLEALTMNWRRRVGEIDLVMREPHDGTIVFVEVRYRKHGSLSAALASIDTLKQRRMTRAARAWLQRYATDDTPARIDVVAVAPWNPAERTALEPAPPQALLRSERNSPRTGVGGITPVPVVRPDRLTERRADHLLLWLTNVTG